MSYQLASYPSKKGIYEFFADPANIFFINIPITIITGLLTNYFQKLIDRKKDQKEMIVINKDNIIVNITENNKFYNFDGIEFDKEKIKGLNKKLGKQQSDFSKNFEIKSPFKEYPIPIFLNHKPKIVGWCILYEDEYGLRAEGNITDETVRRRIDQGRVNGASVTGIAKKTKCSICNSNFVECNHITGFEYEGKECTNSIIKADFVEVSLVKKPINKRCLIGLK